MVECTSFSHPRSCGLCRYVSDVIPAMANDRVVGFGVGHGCAYGAALGAMWFYVCECRVLGVVYTYAVELLGLVCLGVGGCSLCGESASSRYFAMGVWRIIGTVFSGGLLVPLLSLDLLIAPTCDDRTTRGTRTTRASMRNRKVLSPSSSSRDSRDIFGNSKTNASSRPIASRGLRAVLGRIRDRLPTRGKA